MRFVSRGWMITYKKGGPFSAFERDRTSEHTVKGHICDLNLDISALVS